MALSGIVAARDASMPAGAGATAKSSTTRYSACAFTGRLMVASNAITGVPTARATPIPTASTVPAASKPTPRCWPSSTGPQTPIQTAASAGFRAAAATLIRTCPGPGFARGTSATSTTSGPPIALTKTASIATDLLRRRCAERVTAQPGEDGVPGEACGAFDGDRVAGVRDGDGGDVAASGEEAALALQGRRREHRVVVADQQQHGHGDAGHLPHIGG